MQLPEKAMAPTPVLLPGKSYGQRSLAGYSPCGHKELDTTERLNNNNKDECSNTAHLHTLLEELHCNNAWRVLSTAPRTQLKLS